MSKPVYLSINIINCQYDIPHRLIIEVADKICLIKLFKIPKDYNPSVRLKFRYFEFTLVNLWSFTRSALTVPKDTISELINTGSIRTDIEEITRLDSSITWMKPYIKHSLRGLSPINRSTLASPNMDYYTIRNKNCKNIIKGSIQWCKFEVGGRYNIPTIYTTSFPDAITL